MRISIFVVSLTSFFVAIALTGCVTETPNLDTHFGEAVNDAKVQQTINLEASKNINPITDLDGEAANAAVDRYHRSFVQPPVTPNVFNIGVGAGGSSGGTSP